MHEAGAEEDQANRQGHPGEILKRRMVSQILIKPYPGWWNKRLTVNSRISSCPPARNGLTSIWINGVENCKTNFVKEEGRGEEEEEKIDFDANNYCTTTKKKKKRKE